jgi:hypothetical protein
MSNKINCREYLKGKIGLIGMEIALNPPIIDSFSPVICEIDLLLRGCGLVERKGSIYHLKFFRDIYVTSPDFPENPETCVNFGGDEYTLRQILDEEIYIPRRSQLN